MLGERSELETRLQAFCIKIIFEVVCIDVTSKKEGIKRKCATDYMQQKQVPSLWTSYHISFQETPLCLLAKAELSEGQNQSSPRDPGAGTWIKHHPGNEQIPTIFILQPLCSGTKFLGVRLGVCSNL